MAEEQQTYQGRDIRISTDSDGVQLSIDGQSVDIMQDEQSGQYCTILLPYLDYPSAAELAKHLIDYVPDFKS